MFRLGYDIGGTSARVCLFDDESMTIVTSLSRPFPLGQGQEALISLMAEMGCEILNSYGVCPDSMLKVGVGIAGTVNSYTGVLVTACNLHLSDVHIAQMLKKTFPSAKIAVANDADVAALAEYHAGAFRGYDSALLITIGTGIGGGLIMDDRLFQGGRKIGCEIGHITIQQNGPLCGCGNRGCAEALCSATWLLKAGRRSLVDCPNSLISALANGHKENVTAKTVLTAAERGDEYAMKIFDEYVDSLSALITTCCYIVCPRIVGIGGGVSNAGNFLLDPLWERVLVRGRGYIPEKLVLAQLGDSAGMIGAAMLP